MCCTVAATYYSVAQLQPWAYSTHERARSTPGCSPCSMSRPMRYPGPRITWKNDRDVLSTRFTLRLKLLLANMFIHVQICLEQTMKDTNLHFYLISDLLVTQFPLTVPLSKDVTFYIKKKRFISPNFFCFSFRFLFEAGYYYRVPVKEKIFLWYCLYPRLIIIDTVMILTQIIYIFKFFYC